VPLIEVNEDQIHVIERGSGEPVVFLHAFPLEGAMWDYQLDALETSYRCLAFDMPGFGGSPPPADPKQASMKHWANLVVGALDQLGVEKATFVGASMGGYVATAVLRHHPGRVAGLVLADSRARSDDAGQVSRRSDQQQQVRGGQEVVSLAKGLVEGYLSSGSMARPELVTYVHALAEGGTPEGWIAALEAMKNRPDSMLVLRQAKVPSMVMVGELDRVSPIAEARSLRLMLKGELVIIPNVGHVPNIEDPIAFNEALTKFLGGGEAAEAEPGGEGESAVEGETAVEGESAADEAVSADAGDSVVDSES
jgi:pimeloyl-ACP methyl ester carboxylesterase